MLHIWVRAVVYRTWKVSIFEVYLFAVCSPSCRWSPGVDLAAHFCQRGNIFRISHLCVYVCVHACVHVCLCVVCVNVGRYVCVHAYMYICIL